MVSLAAVGIEENDIVGINSSPINLDVSPNPFTDNTTITYSVRSGAKSVGLKIYDVSGRLVKQFNHLSANQRGGIQPFNQIIWNGTDDAGNKLTSGVYFYRLTTEESSATRKLILLR